MSYAPIGSELARNFRKHNPPSAVAEKIFRNSNRVRVKRAQGRTRQNERDRNYPIIVHCHLCWDWVWQRPQQFVSRLSGRHKVLFVETLAPDPQLTAPLAWLRTPEGFANVTILSVQFPTRRWGDGCYVDAERRRLVQEMIAGP